MYVYFYPLHCFLFLPAPYYYLVPSSWSTCFNDSFNMDLILFSWECPFCFCFDKYYCWKRRRQWHPTPILLPGKSHGWRSLVGCLGSLRVGHDWVTSLSLFFSCIGEGNGNPLQCSCLENPRDGRAWWASVYRVAQSRTRLKQLSSSSSIVGNRF